MTTPTSNESSEPSRELAEAKRQNLTKEFFDGQVKLYSALYDKSTAYTNVIIAVGYAGFFGLWSLTKPSLPNALATIAASLMSMSLAIFVLFEVYKITTVGRAAARRATAMFNGAGNPDMQNFVERLREYEAANLRDALRLSRASPWILGPTLVLGLSAYTVLLAAFLCAIVNN